MSNRLLALGLMAIFTGCAAAPRPEHSGIPDTLRYTVERTQGELDEEEGVIFQCDIQVEANGQLLQSPRLTILPSQWASLTVGNIRTRMTPRPWSDDTAEPGLVEVTAMDDGLYVAIRCRDGEGGKIDTEVKAYWFEKGEVVWSREVESRVSSGQEQTI